MKKCYFEKFWNGVHLEEEEEEEEEEEKGRHRNSWMREKRIDSNGMGRQRRMEKKNKTLGTEVYANIDTLYKNIVIIVIKICLTLTKSSRVRFPAVPIF